MEALINDLLVYSRVSTRGKPLKPYVHRDLGLVVDLGGAQAVSKPLGLPLSGPPAQLVARGYHLGALRTFPARFRTAAGWMLNAVAGDKGRPPLWRVTAGSALRSIAGNEW